MKTLFERTSQDDLDRMPITLISRLKEIITIGDLTIHEYVTLRNTFAEANDATSYGDIYGFCEQIFGDTIIVNNL